MKIRKTLIYAAFWLLYLVGVMSSNLLKDFTQPALLNMLVLLIVDLSAFFVTAEGLVPRLVTDVRKVVYWAGLFFLGFSLAMGQYFLDRWLTSYFPSYAALIHPFPLYLVNVYWTMGMALGVGFTYQFYEKHIRMKELESLNSKAELSLLYYKIHPHFLFNMLNNLYSLTLRQAPEAPAMVLRLSELLRYMMDNDREECLLADEVKFIADYVELEKMRYGPEANIRFEAEGAFENLWIKPLLLMPFVENCFKHAGAAFADDFFIHIALRVENDELYLFCENSRVPSNTQDKKRNGGFGLRTAQRRLELLYGPKYYNLEVTESPDRFQINLYLKLQKYHAPAFAVLNR